MDDTLLEQLRQSQERNETLSRELASLHASLDRVLAECGALRRDYEELVDATRIITDERNTLRQRVAELEAANNRLVDMLWGRRSERRNESPDQRHLNFGDDPVEPPSVEQQEIITAQAQADEAGALLAAVAARAEAAEAVAESEQIQSAAAAAAIGALITAGLVEEAAAHEAVTALTAAGLIVAAADQAAADAVAEDAATIQAGDEVAAAHLAESLAVIGAADEVAAVAAGEAGARVRAASITMAEAQVLRYLPKPLPFSVIADKLGISRSAAKERAARLYKRLGVHTRDEAVSRARSLGLIRGE